MRRRKMKRGKKGTRVKKKREEDEGERGQGGGHRNQQWCLTDVCAFLVKVRGSIAARQRATCTPSVTEGVLLPGPWKVKDRGDQTCKEVHPWEWISGSKE
eukprot:Sspe_Gene.99537::Locus_73145_Transcript_1_1_Confidence_1.000_Length_527::g.99537::m.99537